MTEEPGIECPCRGDRGTLAGPLWNGKRSFAGGGEFELNFDDWNLGDEGGVCVCVCVCVLRVPKNLITPLKSLLEVGMALVCA